MNFTISCPSCQRTLRVPEKLLGQAVKCPNCDHLFTAPEQVEEEAPPRAAAAPPQQDGDSGSRFSPRRAHVDDENYEDAPRRRRGGDKPGKVQAIAILILIGGIVATLGAAVVLAYIGILGLATLGAGLLCCLWPGPYYSLVMGIMGIVKGVRLLGEKAHCEAAPYGIANMMIINIINADVVNLTLGILVLVFLADEEVKDFFRA